MKKSEPGKALNPAPSGVMAHDAAPSDPPAHLSPRSCELWRNVIGQVRTAGRQVLLQTALEALDRADQAAELVRSQGMTLRTKKGTGVVRVNPAMAIEAKAREQFMKAWKELRLAVRFSGGA
jgi:phage terminase small subunit